MKKYFIIALTVLTSTAFGQVRRGNSVVETTHVGVFGGLSIANQLVSQPYNGAYSDNSKAGGIAGLAITVPISYGWYIEPEFTYSSMGTKYYYDDNAGFQGNINLNMNYLSLPVLFKYSEPFTGLGVMFGPQYGYLLNASTQPAGSLKSQYEKTDATNDYNRSDLSGVVGIEYYFPNNGTVGPKFGFSARYQFGFLDVNKTAITDGSTIHNNGFFLTAGIRF